MKYRSIINENYYKMLFSCACFHMREHIIIYELISYVPERTIIYNIFSNVVQMAVQDSQYRVNIGY